MRRSLFLLFSIFIGLQMFAQERVTFFKVIPADSINKTTLYVTLKQWVASSYNSAQDVIQMDDKDAGILICNGALEYSPKKITHLSYKGKIRYTLKIQVKDNRYRVEMSNFIHEVDSDRPEDCRLGLITTSELFTDRGMRKNYQNAVWADIKKKVERYSYSLFEILQFETDKIVSSNDSGEEDW